MTVGGMGFIPERLLMMMMMKVLWGEPITGPGRVEGGDDPVLSFDQCFILFSSFPLLLAFDVGGLGFEFCVRRRLEACSSE